GTNFTGYPIIGYQNKLQSSGSCYDSPEDGLNTTCAWDPRIKGAFYYETSFSIALSKVQDFINDVRTLIKLNPKAACLVDQHNGIMIRYLNKSSAYLGKPEESLTFDFSYYRNRDDPLEPRLFEDVMEEIEQMGIVKYQGLPHWGKNRVLAFEGVMEKFKEKVSIYRDGCALDGLCVCKEDVHCAPSKGYFCKPGKVYEKARVCTHVK
ncbi:Probable L-gulonolactone oxidase 1, partial [Linum perenne]